MFGLFSLRPKIFRVFSSGRKKGAIYEGGGTWNNTFSSTGQPHVHNGCPADPEHNALFPRNRWPPSNRTGIREYVCYYGNVCYYGYVGVLMDVLVRGLCHGCNYHSISYTTLCHSLFQILLYAVSTDLLTNFGSVMIF